MALQKQLAEMDNTYRYATLGEQGRQFNAGLGEQGRQFNERSDFDWTQLEALLNRQAYLDAMGSGA